MKKRFMAILLCILLVANLFPAAAALAESGVELTPESFPKSIEKPTNFGVTPKILGTPLKDGRDLESFKFAFSYPEAIKFIYDNRNNKSGVSNLVFGYEIDYKISESGSWHHTSEWDSETLAPEPYHNTMTVNASTDHEAFVKAAELEDLPGSTSAMLDSNTLYFRVRCTVSYKIDNTKAFLISPWSETAAVGKNAQAAELKMEAPVLTEITLDEITSGNFKGKYRLAIKFQVQDSIRAIDNSAGSVHIRKEFKVNNGEWEDINANHEIDGIFYIMPEDSSTGAVIDIKSAQYEVRARYAYSFEKEANPSQWSAYSNILSIGAPAYYKDASVWATPELQKAGEYGLIPDILKGADMTKTINREEFAELAVLLYEKVTEKAASPASPNPFQDTLNPQILKAFSLEITKGTSETTFDPLILINREQCAAMLLRTIKAIAPEGDYSTEGVKDFPDQKDISNWAVEATKYMSKISIIKGGSDGKFMPKATTTVQEAAGYGMATREAAILMAVRTYEQYKP